MKTKHFVFKSFDKEAVLIAANYIYKEYGSGAVASLTDIGQVKPFVRVSGKRVYDDSLVNLLGEVQRRFPKQCKVGCSVSASNIPRVRRIHSCELFPFWYVCDEEQGKSDFTTVQLPADVLRILKSCLPIQSTIYKGLKTPGILNYMKKNNLQYIRIGSDDGEEFTSKECDLYKNEYVVKTFSLHGENPELMNYINDIQVVLNDIPSPVAGVHIFSFDGWQPSFKENNQTGVFSAVNETTKEREIILM